MSSQPLSTGSLLKPESDVIKLAERQNDLKLRKPNNIFLEKLGAVVGPTFGIGKPPSLSQRTSSEACTESSQRGSPSSSAPPSD